ncbi:hypothetical protein CJF31_00005076 [Rutstroemia sp. NJR-2017a BVV2]|nr:hypothetical protein CJF31_00005076 [Rutstroemia sp. NJR-2017a BVV2]
MPGSWPLHNNFHFMLQLQHHCSQHDLQFRYRNMGTPMPFRMTSEEMEDIIFNQPMVNFDVAQYCPTDTYTMTGIPNYDDLDDPIALLESLTRYNSSSLPPPVNPNDQFASLLQAAESAGGEDVRRSQTPLNNNGNRSSTPIRTASPKKTSKRRRDDSSEPEQFFGFIHSKQANPRKRRKPTEEEEEAEARQRAIWGDEPSEAEDEEDESERNNGSADDEDTRKSRAHSLDPRAAGVHSAAALFRRPGPNAKKYTRPAMSKLFTSLEISPEDFITLQAAAKAYMLDENFPERSACVGTKAKLDTDMTKLRLYACVKTFLDQEGWGEKLFGENAPGGATRKNKWPQMQNKLISLVTPLLRRMVTNERQRIYAIEHRKEKDGQKIPSGRRRGSSAAPALISPGLTSPPPFPELDPKLNQLYQESLRANAQKPASPSPAPSAVVRKKGELAYHVNIVCEGKRKREQVTLSPANCVGFASLVGRIEGLIRGEGGGEEEGEGSRDGDAEKGKEEGEKLKMKNIKILSVNGLVEVTDEASWVKAVLGVRKVEWMDGDVKVVVDTEKVVVETEKA